jgi:hypothetical protein
MEEKEESSRFEEYSVCSIKNFKKFERTKTVKGC